MPLQGDNNDPFLLELNKKIRNFNKKLKECNQLEEKEEEGVELNQAQLDKIIAKRHHVKALEEVNRIKDFYLETIQESVNERRSQNKQKETESNSELQQNMQVQSSLDIKAIVKFFFAGFRGGVQEVVDFLETKDNTYGQKMQQVEEFLHKYNEQNDSIFVADISYKHLREKINALCDSYEFQNLKKVQMSDQETFTEKQVRIQKVKEKKVESKQEVQNQEGLNKEQDSKQDVEVSESLNKSEKKIIKKNKNNEPLNHLNQQTISLIVQDHQEQNQNVEKIQKKKNNKKKNIKKEETQEQVSLISNQINVPQFSVLTNPQVVSPQISSKSQNNDASQNDSHVSKQNNSYENKLQQNVNSQNNDASQNDTNVSKQNNSYQNKLQQNVNSNNNSQHYIKSKTKGSQNINSSQEINNGNVQNIPQLIIQNQQPQQPILIQPQQNNLDLGIQQGFDLSQLSEIINQFNQGKFNDQIYTPQNIPHINQFNQQNQKSQNNQEYVQNFEANDQDKNNSVDYYDLAHSIQKQIYQQLNLQLPTENRPPGILTNPQRKSSKSSRKVSFTEEALINMEIENQNPSEQFQEKQMRQQNFKKRVYNNKNYRTTYVAKN